MTRTPSKLLNFIFLAAAIICVLYYIALGVSVRFGQSLDFIWLIFAALFLLRFLLVGRMIRTGEPSILPGFLIKLIHIGFALFVASLIVVESIIISAFATAPPKNLDYIIVLGAKVGSPAINHRSDEAYEYWLENPDTIIIASGGQGDDESMSEADYIADKLISMGVDEQSILREDKSTSTLENLEFSMKLIDKPDAKIGIVTNNFHIYRALKIAKRYESASFYGISVQTSRVSLPHYLLREYFGVLYGLVTGSW